jgi:hypothetical protein
MKLTQQNVNRLASISALGAGILTFAVPGAEASIIVVNPNATVGFSGGSLSSYNVDLPGTHDLTLERTSSTSSHSYRVRFRGSNSNFATSGADRLKIFAAGGAKWSNAGGGLSEFGYVASDFSGNDTTHVTSTDKYFLFRFDDSTAGDSVRYGWGEVAVSFAGDHKPDVELLEYAYDDTGAQVLAGDTGAPSVPEPSWRARAGLGALAIGARGIRSWRAARQSA